MRFLTTLASLACVSFAAGAVAKTYVPQNADKYAEERGFPGLEDPAEQAADVQAREADAPDYEGFAQKNGHYVREAMPMPDEVAGVVAGGEVPELDDDVDMSLEGYEDAHQNLVARSAEPEFESLEGIDTSLEGYEEAHQNLVARSAEPPAFEGLDGVDTSLEGYESEGDEDDDDDDDDDEEDDDEPSLRARDVQEGEDDEEDAYADEDDDDEDDGELEGEEHELVARSLQEEGVDTSLEGYGDMDEADDDNNGDTDDDDEASDEASLQARSVPFRKQGWTKPNMASAMKSAWGSYATKGGARKVHHSHGGGPAGQHLPHHAREAAPEPEPEAKPEAEADPARGMGGKGHHAHAGHNHASHASRPGNKPTGSKTSWAQKPTGTKKAGRGGWGFPW
ncbi:hypothetical protein KC340_g6472 [Hortaea werneckii]|nr:hypothetical protein KC342_g3265 [Hortaea werneckii]KAI7100974.1 hypothetical protein KC339_g7075 [Hortaea werneckii]KAI7242433.1 hypothetical protein KC365_g3172 [Hortaea werneckii]KAI7324232.1 hypothetical protein KC340_g6472 [Hortaea werneckii]KAI7402375.1 hypothetical protein KC328_g2801 [Hortaea werneckii]